MENDFNLNIYEQTCFSDALQSNTLMRAHTFHLDLTACI